MQSTISKQLVKRQDGNWLWAMGHLTTVKITSEMTGGAFALEEKLIAPLPLKGSPLHIHQNEDEAFYILEGTIIFEVEGMQVEANAGDTVWAPRGQKHMYWNPGPNPARILVIVTPAGFEQFFAEVGRPAEAVTLPPAPTAPPDMAKMSATAAKYGVTIFPPKPQ